METTTMLKYEGFNLPTDGLTRLEEITQYGAGNLHKEGWTMVGMCHGQVGDESKLYGVYRLAGDAALVDALRKVSAAEKECAVVKSDVEEIKRKFRDTAVELTETREALEILVRERGEEDTE